MYFLSLIPFALALIGGLVIMYPICPYMSLVWLLIYFALNIFQAACCVACPYRGRYCPAIFGVHIGNRLSQFLYRDYEYEESFFNTNARWAEITLVVFLLYPLYWLYITTWYFVPLYLGLILLHLVLFMPYQCRKCSFSEQCPGGRMYFGLCRLFKKGK